MNRNKSLPLETGPERLREERLIPDKLYFRISEVSKLTGLEPYVLRYWESEFKMIKPIRTKSRHRLYKRRDLEIILEIKKLLYEEQYTIAGAKKRLEEIVKEEREDVAPAVPQSDFEKVLQDILAELKSLRNSLS